MNFIEYQQKAMSFRLPSANSEYALLNLAGEVGEVLSLEAKLIRDGASFGDLRTNMKKELGDVLWCLTAIADDYNFDLSEIAQANIDKLTSRKVNNTIQGSGDER